VVLNNIEASGNLAAQTNLSVLETLLDAPVIELAYQESDFSNVRERLQL